MSLLVETIKIENGKVLNISFHNERIIRSLYGIFGIRSEPDLDRKIIVPESAKTGVYKCRIVYNDKAMHIEFLPYTIRPVRSLKLIVDENICYPYKYIARDKINRLLEMRAGCDEILIIKNGKVTDTSYSNVVFRDFEGNWITPSTYLLPGTRRANLLKNKLISEVQITVDDVSRYTEVRLINAMLGLEDTEGIPIKNIV